MLISTGLVVRRRVALVTVVIRLLTGAVAWLVSWLVTRLRDWMVVRNINRKITGLIIGLILRWLMTGRVFEVVAWLVAMYVA